LPCTDITLKARVERKLPYPKELKTWGDHLRKKRLDLGLLRKEVAEQIGVDETSVYHWESNRTQPRIWLRPHLVQFLGYVPYWPLNSMGERIAAARSTLGYSRKRFARLIQVDESTLWRWERGVRNPCLNYVGTITQVVEREIRAKEQGQNQTGKKAVLAQAQNVCLEIPTGPQTRP
jgi:transcriptional regulator with XRE-family HTH domain